MGIGELVVNLFFFVVIFIELRPEKLKWALFFIVSTTVVFKTANSLYQYIIFGDKMCMCSQAIVVAIVFSIVMIESYYEVLTAKGLKTDVVRVISLFVKTLL